MNIFDSALLEGIKHTFADALPGLSALYGSPGVSAAGDERSDPESPMPDPGPPGKERLRLPAAMALSLAAFMA